MLRKMLKRNRNDTPEINRVCIALNNHSMLQYLLISSLEEIEHTFFFFGDNWSESVLKNIPHKKVFHLRVLKKFYIVRFLYWFFLKYLKYVFWPFLKNAEYFALDHDIISELLLYDHNYCLLEDGLGNYRTVPIRHTLTRRIRFHLFSPVSVAPWGKNGNCQKIFLTQDMPVDPVIASKVSVMPFEELWRKATEEKRECIRDLFNIPHSIASYFENIDTCILTAPYIELGFFTEEENAMLYKRIMDLYNITEENCLFKLHPFEKTSYVKYFPKAKELNTFIPMELLIYFIPVPRRVLTINSTAILAFRNTAAELIFTGTEIDKKLSQKMGHIKSPLSGN